MKTSQTIPVAILIGGVIVAIAVYLSVTASEPSTASGSGNPSAVRPVNSTDHILGSPSAQVDIIEYSDFDCSFCKGYDTTLHQVISDMGGSGKVAWVYREFPLTELHPNAFTHAEAAECASLVSGNDAFWKFADSLFANQPTDPNRYGELAKAAGIDTTAFAACYQNAKATVDPRINADIQNGKDAGANGTPYTVITTTGKTPIVIPGAYSYADVESAVNQLLGTGN